MAIDFGLIHATDPGVKVMGQRPIMPNPLGQLASGIVSGAKQGSDMLDQQQARAQSQQAMTQSAALAPSRLATAQANAQTSTIDAQNAQAQQNLSAGARQAALNNGVQGYMNYLKQNDPASFIEVSKKISDTQQAQADASKKLADSTTAQLKAQQGTAIFGMNLAKMAHQADQNAQQAVIDPQTGKPKIDPKTGQPMQPDPQAGQKVYQMGLQQAGPSIASTLPQDWNDKTYHALSILGTQATIDQQKAAEGKVKSTELTATQNQIQTLTQQIQQDKADGKDTTQQEGFLAAQKMKADALTKGKVGESKLDADLDQVDAKAVGSAISNGQLYTKLGHYSQQALNLSQELSEQDVGKMTDQLQINAYKTKVQELKKLMAPLGFLMKGLVGLTPGMRITDNMVTQLREATGGTNVNLPALKAVLQNNIDNAVGGIHEQWAIENKVRANGSPERYQAWQKANPEPYNPDKTATPLISSDQLGKPELGAKPTPGVPQGRIQVKDKGGKIGHIPADQLEAAIQQGYTKVGK